MIAKLTIKTRHQSAWIPAGTKVTIQRKLGNKTYVHVPGYNGTLVVFSCFLETLAEVIQLPISQCNTEPVSISMRTDESEFLYGERFNRYLKVRRSDSDRVDQLVQSFGAPRKVGMGSFWWEKILSEI